MLEKHRSAETLHDFLLSLILTGNERITSVRVGAAENWVDVYQHPDLPFVLYFYPISYQGYRYKHTDHSKNSIHLDEDAWLDKSEIVKNRLKSRVGLLTKIGARETVAARIDKIVAMQFQKSHHLHFALPGKYRYGLFLRGELVAIAVFSGGRRMDGETDDYRSFELLRFCHKKGLQVVGGLSKLLNAFQKTFDPGDIMTYVDLDWAANIRNYESLGFQAKKTIPPISKHFARTGSDEVPSKWNSGSIKLVKRLK